MAPTDLYRVIHYPEPGYQVDEPAQSTIREYAKRKDRRLKAMFISMMSAFGLAIALGFAHVVAGMLVCLAGFVVLFVIMVGLLLSVPSGRLCSTCGGRLEKVTAPTSYGFAAEYRICRKCRLYRYMFRTSRR